MLTQELCNEEDHQFAHNDDADHEGHWYCLACGIAVDEECKVCY